jgi:peptidoglycan/xylan/chitin deacetylase (PgdA/CDA1 family)
VDLQPAELEREVRGSATTIASLGLPQPTVFAYPYGSWNARVAASVKAAGYAAAFTIEPGLARASSDHFALPRIEVFGSDSPAQLASKLARARRRWRVGRGR